MTKNINFVSHKKSKQIVDGKPKLPLASSLAEGEIAVNYAEDVETLSIKNESGTVVTFSSDNYFKNQYLAWEKGSGIGSAVLVGSSGTASGNYSVSEGYMTTAVGNFSHAEGAGTSAITSSYPAAHAEGLSTYANGGATHAEGFGTSATTTDTQAGAHAEGYSTYAAGQGAHAEGQATKALYTASHAEGNSTSASSMFSHAEGNGTLASGNSSHAEGLSSKATGNYSHAEGDSTSATSMSSHAEGSSTLASGQYSHAEGSGAKANGSWSHAEGSYTVASGQASHAEGYSTYANGADSHAEGANTVTNNDYEHASGRFNVSSSANTAFGSSGNTLFSVGNGTADNARHNAFEIRQNGDIYIVSGGTDILLQDHIGVSGPTYTPGDGIDITNDVISVTGKTDISAFTAHTGDSTIHVASSDKTAWNNKIGYAEYDSTDKKIYFYKNSTDTATSLCYVDATDFIKDGMVQNVEVKNVAGSGTCLVITFNTDSGKEDINIPISDIFDANNYYTKSETSGATELSTAFTAIDNKFGTGFTVSSVTEVIEENERVVSAALNDLEENKLDASAYTPTDLSNYYQKSETSGATELSTAFAGKADTSHTHVASAVTAMTGYAIATSASSISTTDTLIEAIGKLEKRIALLEAALIVQDNGDVYGSGGDYE